MADPIVDARTKDISKGYDEVVRGIGRMTQHLGADAGDAVSKSAAAFVHAASDLAHNIQKQSAALAKKAGKEISEHPVATAALAAAAVGLLGYAVTHTRKSPRKARPQR